MASSFFNNFTCNILHCRINDIRNIIYNAWDNCIIIINGPCTNLHIKVSIGTKIFVMLILQQKIIVADEPVKKLKMANVTNLVHVIIIRGNYFTNVI